MNFLKIFLFYYFFLLFHLVLLQILLVLRMFWNIVTTSYFFKYRYYFNLMFLNCLSYLVVYLKKFSFIFDISISFVTFSFVGNFFIWIILYYFGFFFNVFGGINNKKIAVTKVTAIFLFSSIYYKFLYYKYACW